MKKLFYISVFTFLVACGETTNSDEISISEVPSNILEKMTYSVDTLVVDSGEALFNLKDMSKFGKHNYFSVNKTGDLMYFFDRHRLLLQEVDLNKLKLVNVYPFEEEGPNGVGRFVYTFKNLSDGTFYVRNLFGDSWIFGKSGEKITNLELNGGEILRDTQLESFSISTELEVDLKRKKLYSMPSNFHSDETYFALMDSTGQRGKLFDLVEFEKIGQYKIEWKGGSEGGAGKAEQRFLQQLNDLVIVSSTVGNAIYIYDLERDSLMYREFAHELTPLEKDIEIKHEVVSSQEYQAESDKLHTQIDYWDFYWNEKTQLYYRFASMGLPLANIDSPKKYEYFMFAYGKDLTLKGEVKLEGLSELPLGGFFKDGKLYSYVNVEDELGFAVFTFDF